MSLAKLIHRNKADGVANAADARTTAQSNKEASLTLAKVATLAVANPKNEKINRDIQIIRTWLYSIGEPEEDHYLILNKCKNDPEALAYYLECAYELKRKERRAKALAILADDPKAPRAIIADTNADPDNVILTIAIRNQYSFEMTIPKAKYDPFTLLEFINKVVMQ